MTRVGAQPGALVEAGQALLEVADYSRPLVRVPGSSGRGRRRRAGCCWARRRAASGSTRTLVGPSPEADPRHAPAAYLYRADRAWPGATPGTPVVARRCAGARDAGQRRAGARFGGGAVGRPRLGVSSARARPLRARASADRSSGDAAAGWPGRRSRAGDTVVVRGAQELLSEEFRARVTVGDESGE